MSDPSPRPVRLPRPIRRNPEPLLTRRTLLLLVGAILLTLLFVREHRRQQGPCRPQFNATRAGHAPRLLRVQDDEESPGDAGPAPDPCNSRTVFGFSAERTFAALALALWGTTIYCAVQDISYFLMGRRRQREWNAHHAVYDSGEEEDERR